MSSRFFYVWIWIVCMVIPLGTKAETCDMQFLEHTQSVQTGQVLTKISFYYTLVHSEGCELKVMNHRAEGRQCDDAVVRTLSTDRTSSVKRSVEVTCEYYHIGHFYEPPVYFNLIDKSGHRQNYFEYIDLEIIPFHDVDVKALHSSLVLKSWKEWPVYEIIVGVILVVLTVCGGLVYRQYRIRRRRLEQIANTPPEKSALELFVGEIEALYKISPDDVKEVKRFHDGLSLAVRNYIERKLGIGAINLTTYQIYHELGSHSVSEENREEIKSILSTSDFVKFSNQSNWENEISRKEQTIERAKHVIESVDREIEVSRQKTLENICEHEEADDGNHQITV